MYVLILTQCIQDISISAAYIDEKNNPQMTQHA